MTIKDASSAFLSRCLALNLAKDTLKWYSNILRDLERFLAAKDVLELQAAQTVLLRLYLADLRLRGQSSQTISGTFGALRCAFKFWRREGFLVSNPMELIERPRRERYLIRPLSPEQATKLIAQPNTSTTAGLRDRAMIMLILDSGLRVTEVTTLEAERIDWANRALTVMGKGRKERSVPFSERTGAALLEYSRRRGERGIHGPEFFLNRSGRQLDRGKFRRMLVQYGRNAGITGVRMSPHTLRHTFAVFYIRNGGDSFSLQEILGHSTLEMTKRYVNLGRGDVAAQHVKYSPIDRLLGNTPPRAP